jgi:hypothetical protein
MTVDRVRRAWVRAAVAHARAAESHDVAAELFASQGDERLAAGESELATAERRMYASELSRHPEWAKDVAELLVVRPAMTLGRSRDC